MENRVETLSICIVAYNEEKYLPQLFADLKSQLYPHELIEVILVDSASKDKTYEVMQDFKASETSFRNIEVLTNEKRVQAAGWNIAISNATSDVIVRIDAHTHVPEDFSVKVMNEMKNGEMVVGGVRPCLIENNSSWGSVLLNTENSLFGSSINKSRRSVEKQYVKTMFHAAYRREVFAKTGGFNENLLRTEDNEFHYRVRENGYKLCYNPEIVSYQYARNSLKRMVRQKYGNGYWVGLTTGVCPKCLSIYHFIPLAFVLGIILTTIFCFFGFWQLATIMWGLYALFGVANMILVVLNEKTTPLVLLMPFLFLILHVSYGVGTFVGLIKMPWRRKKLKRCSAIEKVKDIYLKK